MRVVLPDPASPTTSVTPLRLAIPYSRLPNTSRCESVSTRKRGFGVRSKGRSRKPKKSSYITDSANKGVDQDGEAGRHATSEHRVQRQARPEVLAALRL